MIAEDIEEESDSPMKPKPNTQTFSNINQKFNETYDVKNYKYQRDEVKNDFKKISNNGYQDNNTLSTGRSTGLSGCESTPSNSVDKRFVLNLN